MKIRLLIISLFLLSLKSQSQQNDFELPFTLGIYGGMQFNFHNPAFTYKTDSSFLLRQIDFKNNTTSLGLNIGGIINVPISKTFVFSGRLGYHAMGGDLDHNVSKTIINDTAYTYSSLDASISYLEISPMLQIHNLLPWKRLYLLTGLEFGIPLSGSYKFEETHTFANQTVIKSTPQDNIPDKNLRFALGLGLGYVFNLSENVYLSPELSYRIPFTRVSAAPSFDSWEIPQLRLGVALTFGFAKEKPPVKEVPTLEVGFKEVNYFDKQGNRSPLKKITVEEVQYKELFPLVPYVFFDENKPEPSNTQVLSAEAQSGEFTIKALKPDAMNINMHTLDIIGHRMAENQATTLTITGTTDEAGELANKDLAQKRAEFARNYLSVNYGISPGRIQVVSRGLPEIPSAKKDTDGVAENRRIEFSSPNRELMEPIMIEGEKNSIAEPDQVQFVPYIITNDTLVSWELEVVQSDNSIQKINGVGQPDPVDWNITPNMLTAGSIPLEYTFKAETSTGLKKSASGSVPVDFISTSRKKVEDLPDKTISKFSLILFDFDKADISERDMEIIEKNIIPEIKYNSTVKIYGYTDRIGDSEYNQKLAERRANSVLNVLQSRAKSAKFEVFGVGEKNLIFDNDNPTGRHLSRTVQVYVVTPKN